MKDDQFGPRKRGGVNPDRTGRAAAGDALAIDLRALADRTARDLPTLHQTMLAAREGHAHNTPGGLVMSMLHGMKRRPMFSSLAVGAVIALALLVVPVSYTKTAGQDVTLTLSGPGLNDGIVRKIAKEYAAALQGKGVRVALEETTGASGRPERTFRLETRVASSSRRATERVASAFASALGDRGIVASAAVTPRTERVSGNVYAAAGNSICSLTIDRRGRSAEEVEASIKSQLEAAGIQNPTVDVTLDGNLTTVQIKANDACGREGETQCQIKLQVHGEGADEAQMVTLHCGPNCSPEEIRARIRDELQARGIDADVTVTSDGCGTDSCRVEVRVEREQ